MRSRILISVLLLVYVSDLAAQRVVYCTPIDDRYSIKWEVAGRAGDYYWLQITRKRRPSKRHTDPGPFEEQSFDIYDSRMNPVRSVPIYPPSETTLKEYFIPGEQYFDQLMVLGGNKRTSFLLQRYEPEGSPVDSGRIVGTFPFEESGNSFLLIRSQDRSLILLVGFESMPTAAPRLHAILFDQNWRQLYSRIYSHPGIIQPYIQDDFAGYPLEDYNKSPLKLANNGQFLMAIPSRTSQNFLLFHFRDTTAPTYKELELPPSSNMEDVDLSIDNRAGEAYAGVLSTVQYDVLKHVRVAHYSLSRKVIDFDTAYRLNTLVAGKVREENLVKENFMAVPGKGFMLLKEYGRPFTEWYGEGQDSRWDPALLFTGEFIPDKGVSFPVTREGYARYGSLKPLGNTHERGDLSLFYFAGNQKDSCWSGILSKEQVTELNSPNLSYLVVPLGDRLFFLYNAYIRNENQYATTTILDPKGELLAQEGVFFWKYKNALDFQQSRQISAREIVVPYGEFQRRGFALIRF